MTVILFPGISQLQPTIFAHPFGEAMQTFGQIVDCYHGPKKGPVFSRISRDRRLLAGFYILFSSHKRISAAVITEYAAAAPAVVFPPRRGP
jgi:hypothetical protein